MSVPFLREEGLAALGGVCHGFFTRQGGVSQGLYASLNAGPGSRDDAAAVAENRARIATAMGAPSGRLSTLYQVHGRAVVTLAAPLPDGERPEADGMVTRTPGVLLGVLSADCVPVLFADRRAGVIGAAHAGWKGALAGITDATIEAMLALGAGRVDIHAAIGPSIGWGSYEVDQAFRQCFLDADPACRLHFRAAPREGRWLFDVKGYVAARLARSGVSRIGMLAHDTCRDEASFFSYRRATLRGEADYGRQLSAIMLAPSRPRDGAASPR